MDTEKFKKSYPILNPQIITDKTLNNLFSAWQNKKAILEKLKLELDVYSSWVKKTHNNPPDVLIDWRNFYNTNWTSNTVNFHSSTGFSNNNIFYPGSAETIVYGVFPELSYKDFLNSSGWEEKVVTADNFIRFNYHYSTIYRNFTKRTTYKFLRSFSSNYWQYIRRALLIEAERAKKDPNKRHYGAYPFISQRRWAQANINHLPTAYYNFVSKIDNLVNVNYRSNVHRHFLAEIGTTEKQFKILYKNLLKSSSMEPLFFFINLLENILKFRIKKYEMYTLQAGSYNGFNLQRTVEEKAKISFNVNIRRILAEFKVLLHSTEMLNSAKIQIKSAKINYKEKEEEAKRQSLMETEKTKREILAIKNRYRLALQNKKDSNTLLCSNILLMSQDANKK